jgi:transcription elongation GreA/GreB family factor
VDKAALLAAIVAQLVAEVELLGKAALESHADATAEDNKAENKYDTRGLEASYLAEGQSRAAEEVAQSLAQFRALTLPAAGRPVTLGSLVVVEDQKRKATHYFVGPRAGGTEVTHAGHTVMVITPVSPLGRQLVGRRPGDSVQLEFGGRHSEFRVVRVE